jgi:hypothetical protein
MLVVEVTEHAIKRYGERVRPALDDSQLEAEVLRVVHDVGEVSWHPLGWCVADDAKTVGWIHVGPDIAFPLQFHWSRLGVLVATTCLTRGSFGEDMREARNRRARDRRQRRAARRRDSYVPGARQAA